MSNYPNNFLETTLRWDQADFTAHLEQLDSETAILETALQGAGKETPARPEKSEDVVESCENAEMHNARLRGMLRGAGVKPQVFAMPAQAQAKPAPLSETSKPTAKKQTSDEQIALALAPKREREQRQAALQQELWPQYKAGTLTMDEMCRRINAVK